MRTVEPYQELGVLPSATAAEIRQAYVSLARRFHPDHQAGDTAARYRMADINAAWAILGDEQRRAAYDAGRRGEPDHPGGATIRDATTWTALDEDDDDADVEVLDDTPTGARRLPRWLTVAPGILFLTGAGVVVFGMMLKLGVVTGAGVLLMAGAAAAFVGLPVLAMINSSRAERDW